MKQKSLLLITVSLFSYIYINVIKSVPITIFGSLPENVMRLIYNSKCLPFVLCSHYIAYTVVFAVLIVLTFKLLARDITKGQ